MKEAKKKSHARIYVTFAVIIIICGLIGGIVGVAAVSNEFSVRNLGEQFNLMLASLGPWCYLPGFSLLIGATWYYFRGKRLIPKALADDEAFPQANLTLCRAMFLANLATVLMFLAMALSYASSWGFNLSWFLLIGHIIWMTAIQARIISATKKLFPEKRGDIFDFKFQKDWYESCDEAERQQTAQCSYQAFKVMGLIFPGIMAILSILSVIDLVAPSYSLLVGGLWLVQQFVYNYTSLQMDKKRS